MDEYSFTDPAEVRKILREKGYYGMPLYEGDVVTPGATPIVRAVFDMARARGFSELDTYTALAWHLMHSSARMQASLLQQFTFSKAPPLFPPPI